MRMNVVAVALVLVSLALPAAENEPPTADQLELVRSRIGTLELRLTELDAENRSRQE